MTVDQTSTPNDPNFSPRHHQWAPQTPRSPRKAKFLCSFGGKILPRPVDGALRYVGGHTRIISVPNDIPFQQLMAKMSEVCGGSPTILKYQLPDEDLDALISVSCTEDLENMMDEYEKLVQSSPDGSVKLRAFLFSPSDGGSDLGVVDMNDTGQRYFEAVNGISNESGSSNGSLKRKDSGLSAGSSNSGVGMEAGDGITINEGMSTSVVSPENPNYNDRSYLDPNQVQFLNTQPVNLVNLQVNSQASNLKPVENFRAVQPLSQLPPLPPAYQYAQNVDDYGMNSQGVSFDDCYMCQKMLPHAHSDTLVQNTGGGTSPGMGNNASPVFYSEDALKRKDQMNLGESQLGGHGFPQVVADSQVERPFVQKMLNLDHARVLLPPSSMGLSPESQYEGERLVIQKMENLGHSRVFLPQGSMGMSPDSQAQSFIQNKENLDQSRVFLPAGSTGLLPDSQAQSSYGLFLGNFGQSPPESQMQQQPQLHQNLVSAHYPLQPEVLTNEYVRPINEMMEGLRLSPTQASGSNLQGNSVGMPDTSPLIIDGTYGYMPQVGENVLLPSRSAFVNAGVIQDSNYVSPINQSDLTHIHNLNAADSSQVFPVTGNQDPFPHHLGLRAEPPIHSEGLLAMPSYTSGVTPTYSNRPINQIPTDQFGILQSGNVPFGLGETFQEQAFNDSLFCNQDPKKILGGAHPLPPRPKRVASRDFIAPKDSGVQIHTGNSNASDIIALLEEGGLHPSPHSLNKDSHLDPVQTMKGSGDEQIRQDLQAVAEGVASSVLDSSLPHAPVFVAHDTPDYREERQGNEDNASPEQKVEDNKPKTGLQITDDIGRLQIIKSSDLEELRELGSGTFGTVYHGKWRGSDVAIKRINDRCFAGKPSEQERMRADFWNEACKLADLHHPNVVAFYGVVLDGPGGSVATVTEYMVNGSLRNALQRNDKILDRRRRLLIAMDVAFGMEYLHGKNIVHFDLKSDNLLVNLRDPHRPICKVGDLGLSKVKCQTLISGGVRGTLPWMAPELLNGSSSLVSEKVDVFSFGIVMWELITGEEPYADLHYGAIIGGIVSNTLRPPVPESCDPVWRALMERCWSADPSERPSFTEIAEKLRSMAASGPVKGHAQAQIQK